MWKRDTFWRLTTPVIYSCILSSYFLEAVKIIFTSMQLLYSQLSGQQLSGVPLFVHISKLHPRSVLHKFGYFITYIALLAVRHGGVT